MEEAEAKDRKERFVTLLNHLLDRCQGVKGKLAQQLNIKPSTLTPWLQGKIDPASLETLVFDRIAEVAGYTPDFLAKTLKIIEIEKEQDISQEQFKSLIEQVLLTQSREQLGLRLGVSHKTISNCLNPERNIDPGKILIGTLAKLAIERGWTIERLLFHLNLKKIEKIEQDTLALIQSQSKQLSLNNRIKLLSWLFADFEKIFSNSNLLIINNQECFSKFNDRTLLIILEQENMAIASNYLQKLYVHTNINPENITIRVADPSFARGATIQQLPDPIDSDTLIFDISTPDSPSIALIQEISFDGDIVVLASENLPENLRAGLEDRVTDVLVKPIDWSSLKDKEYFR